MRCSRRWRRARAHSAARVDDEDRSGALLVVALHDDELRFPALLILDVLRVVDGELAKGQNIGHARSDVLVHGRAQVDVPLHRPEHDGADAVKRTLRALRHHRAVQSLARVGRDHAVPARARRAERAQPVGVVVLGQEAHTKLSQAAVLGLLRFALELVDLGRAREPQSSASQPRRDGSATSWQLPS